MTSKQESLDRLKEISEYKENWDGYGTEPFSSELIKNCEEIVNQMIVAPMIFPTANNSIQFEYVKQFGSVDNKNDTYIELEIYESNCQNLYKGNLWLSQGNTTVGCGIKSFVEAVAWWNILTGFAENQSGTGGLE